MSGKKWYGFATRRLDFSAFKGGKTEYLIAGVLGLVILGAAYGIYKGISGPPQPKGPDWFMYKCGSGYADREEPNCGYEFKVAVKDLPKPQHMADERDVMKIDCPQCRAKHSCWQERECPACHKFFVLRSEIARYDALTSGRPDAPQGIKDVCPHCGTDINEWFRANANKKK